MKIKSLIPAMAAFAFAVAAHAQSDPSVGGSFGTSFDHTVPADLNAVSQSPDPYRFDTTNVQTHRSFWDKMTGRNRSMPSSAPSRSDHSRSWFHRSGGQHTGWFSSHTSQSRTDQTKPTANPRKGGWHLPWFHRR